MTGRLVKGRLNAGLVIIEGNGGRLKLVSASTAARVSNGSLRRWSINPCLVVTAAHKARSMRGKPIELSDEEVSEIMTRSLGHERKSGWEQVTGRAD
jgi:hypothetical protein